MGWGIVKAVPRAVIDYILKLITITAIGPGTATGCHNGDGGRSCCSSSNQCAEGEGDCDDDDDCSGNLKCGQGNGFDDNCDTSLGFGSKYDCCYDPDKCKNL